MVVALDMLWCLKRDPQYLNLVKSQCADEESNKSVKNRDWTEHGQEILNLHTLKSYNEPPQKVF